MSRPLSDLPERLIESDATPFERRVLDAALRKQPSPAASARMAKAVGVTVAAVGTATAASTLAADAAAAKATAAVATTSLWPWISVGVIGLVVAGAVVGTRAGRHARERHPVSPAVTAPVQRVPPAVAEPAAAVAEAPPRAVAPTQRGRAVTAAGDLRDQVAFIDSARAAMSADGGRRALEILRRYLDRYPAGSFRPEAIALEVEALMKLGREAEARALAGRFIAEHRGSLLARRVADVAGLTAP
jgi:hypothetical protein